MTERETVVRKETEIDLQKLFSLYLQRWWIIVLCLVIGGLAMMIYSMNFITPLYRSSVTFYVNNSRASQPVESISNANLVASQQLVNTYITILKSDSVMSKVVEKLGEEDMTVQTLKDMISVSQVDETELFKVYVSSPDPERAASIANCIASVAPEQLEYYVEGSSTKVIDYAVVPDHKYKPSITRYTELGALAGAVIAVAVITLIHVLDVRIKEESDLTELFAYPVLGKIPLIEGDEAAVKKLEAQKEKQEADNG